MPSLARDFHELDAEEELDEDADNGLDAFVPFAGVEELTCKRVPQRAESTCIVDLVLQVKSLWLWTSRLQPLLSLVFPLEQRIEHARCVSCEHVQIVLQRACTAMLFAQLFHQLMED